MSHLRNFGLICILTQLTSTVITKEMNDVPGLYSMLVELSLLEYFREKSANFVNTEPLKRRRSTVVKCGSENNKTNIFNQTMN